ncbi:hypothetical protein [Comamonas endophytica]|uniref:Uncharacterized protein n=1 Tax=Comamonas endophytica TaxID=2949090 RepID=A0ABY6G5J6_9BURK|nr:MULTISPECIES: hypothetical protein [unclassified Acidovorax]MCD2512273.1 hypothetical protein [Acidovorax sp. D4N7]UYG50270.1 hypothetical protein M9799_09090 [Acidovorax sp. 5MLIR]
MSTPSTEPRTAYPEHFQAVIRGHVQHRVGDGALEDIPVGQKVDVATAIASLVLSWESEGQPVTVTLAKEEFDLYVSQGDIEVQGSNATTAAASA